MRTLQNIFDTVIAHKLYSNSFGMYMCSSLKSAKKKHLISEEEYKYAKKSICNYLSYLFKREVCEELTTLAEAKWCSGIKTKKSNFDIYKDWKNRPRYKKVTKGGNK